MGNHVTKFCQKSFPLFSVHFTSQRCLQSHVSTTMLTVTSASLHWGQWGHFKPSSGWVHCYCTMQFKISFTFAGDHTETCAVCASVFDEWNMHDRLPLLSLLVLVEHMCSLLGWHSCTQIHGTNLAQNTLDMWTVHTVMSYPIEMFWISLRDSAIASSSHSAAVQLSHTGIHFPLWCTIDSLSCTNVASC